MVVHNPLNAYQVKLKSLRYVNKMIMTYENYITNPY